MSSQVSYRTKTIQLPVELSDSKELVFDKVILFVEPRLPLAIVNYSLQGAKQADGLRIDLDKEVFLDHLESESLDELAVATAPRIVSHLGDRDIWRTRGRRPKPKSRHRSGTRAMAAGAD